MKRPCKSNTLLHGCFLFVTLIKHITCYHLFYQYYLFSRRWEPMHRGHAVSSVCSIGLIYPASWLRIRTTNVENEHYAIIDQYLVWHGGMNLLGKEDVWDNLIRVENSQAAAELMEISEMAVSERNGQS